MMFAATAEGGGGFGVPVSEILDATDEDLRPLEPGPCPA
jgi:hypothetical protein